MKTLKLSLIALAFAGIFASCSTCYECQQEITINGQTEWSDPETRCSADGSEIEELENQGFRCTSA